MNPPIKFRCRQPLRNDSTSEPLPEPISEDPVLFATHGSHGVVDLGATKTVIGSNHVAELIKSLHPKIRNQLSRCPCQVTFRFGNHGTLKSEQALVVPLQGLNLKIAIVPGSTPFLISNTLLRAFEAVIDVEKHVMWSKKFHQEYPLQLTSKGLFLIDLNVLAANTAHPVSTKPAETHVAETNLPKSSLPPSKIRSVSFQDAQQKNTDQRDLADAPVVGSKTLKSSPVPVSIQPSVCSVPAKVQDRSKPIECVNSVSQSSMASLIERLQKLQVQTPEELPDVSQYSLAQMDVMRVEFGTKHVGRPTRRYGHPTNSGSHGSQALPEQQERSSPHDAPLHRSQNRASRDGGEEHSCGRTSAGAGQNPTKALGKPSVMALTPKAKSRPMVTPEVEDLSVWELGEMEAEETPIEPNMTENLEQRHAECGRSPPIDCHAPRAHGDQPSSSTEPCRKPQNSSWWFWWDVWIHDSRWTL